MATLGGLVRTIAGMSINSEADLEKYVFSRPYISRVYPNEREADYDTSYDNDFTNPTEGSAKNSFSFDMSPLSDEVIDTAKLRTIFGKNYDRWQDEEKEEIQVENVPKDSPKEKRNQAIFSISKDVTSSDYVEESITSAGRMEKSPNKEKPALELDVVQGSLRPSMTLGEVPKFVAPRKSYLKSLASRRRYAPKSSAPSTVVKEDSSTTTVSQATTSEPVTSGEPAHRNEPLDKEEMMSKPLSSQESVSAATNSVGSSGSHTNLLGRDEKTKKTVSISASKPRRSSFSFFRNNLTQNGDVSITQETPTNKKVTRTPPLERLKSRKFSLSLGRLPEILTGKKADDEKDGADGMKQDGASVVDFADDAPERKQDDYSRLLEPNRFAQVITVLTVLTVVGLLLALIVRISMGDDTPYTALNGTEITTQFPNTTGIT